MAIERAFTPVFAQTLTRAFAALALLLCVAGGAAAQGVSASQLFGCNQAAQYDASTMGATKLVSGVANKQIYVCGFSFFSAGTASVGLDGGTGGTCGANTVEVTPSFQMTANGQIVDHQSFYAGLPPVPASSDLCIDVSAMVAVQAIVYYTQF